MNHPHLMAELAQSRQDDMLRDAAAHRLARSARAGRASKPKAERTANLPARRVVALIGMALRSLAVGRAAGR